MKVTLEDGTTRDMTFNPANCTGYRAWSIELEARDIRAMRGLAWSSPSVFQVAMKQLEARFPEARAGGDLS